MFLQSEVPPPLDFSFKHWLCLENCRSTLKSVAVFPRTGKSEALRQLKKSRKSRNKLPQFFLLSCLHCDFQNDIEIKFYCFLCQFFFCLNLTGKMLFL